MHRGDRRRFDALASETGFAGRVNLYRAFKRKTEVSPTDWDAYKSPLTDNIAIDC
ncbi:hypothetical protein [uncultured Prevotella sp.]|uniref:hypothetical protein n=1 Tax=uncultured Prevotella sp. TaxID=159272 RepID=UPI00258F14C1|nr:hypothetical protein [uncultured Prevotella sp.]